jgi:hypothetical protein
MFQPELSVRTAGGVAAFAARRLDELAHYEDADMESMELLYWNRPEYAVGHGCAVTWEAAEGHTFASELRTVIIPAYELARIDPREDVPGELNMWKLGGPGADGLPGSRLNEMLMPLADAYRAWIDNDLRGELLAGVEPTLRTRALSHIEACEIAHERIVEGIQILIGGDEANRLAREGRADPRSGACSVAPVPACLHPAQSSLDG